MPFAKFESGLRFFLNRLGEKLWVKPLLACALSIVGVFVAKAADSTHLVYILPQITAESIETMLSIMASSMLVIATLAVASMVSAYSSASNAASPRTFPLVIADDVSQYALSIFVGAFIFSIVGLLAAKNGYYEAAGRFILFLLTVFIFGIVIFTFVTWIDRIARLGRLGMTIDKVARATASALENRKDAPLLNGISVGFYLEGGQAIFSNKVGYVQHIDMGGLQSCAENTNARIEVAVLPGAFVAPGRVLAYVHDESPAKSDYDGEEIANKFVIGNERKFEEDPRYGLVVLSQIAGHALSPAINDPGTAIDIIGVMVRLFVLWGKPLTEPGEPKVYYDRILVPELSVQDMFDDAFTAIARDGAGSIEVSIRLLKALSSLATIGDSSMQDASKRHTRRALALAEKAPHLPEDLAALRGLASFANDRVHLKNPDCPGSMENDS